VRAAVDVHRFTGAAVGVVRSSRSASSDRLGNESFRFRLLDVARMNVAMRFFRNRPLRIVRARPAEPLTARDAVSACAVVLFQVILPDSRSL
jgi:hypothetical protein